MCMVKTFSNTSTLPISCVLGTGVSEYRPLQSREMLCLFFSAEDRERSSPWLQEERISQDKVFSFSFLCPLLNPPVPASTHTQPGVIGTSAKGSRRRRNFRQGSTPISLGDRTLPKGRRWLSGPPRLQGAFLPEVTHAEKPTHPPLCGGLIQSGGQCLVRLHRSLMRPV